MSLMSNIGRRDRWKLGNKNGLIDLKSDPAETAPIGKNTAESVAVRKRLQAVLDSLK